MLTKAFSLIVKLFDFSFRMNRTESKKETTKVFNKLLHEG